MYFYAWLGKKNNVVFAVISVKPSVFSKDTKSKQAIINTYSKYFSPNTNIVLRCKSPSHTSKAKYYGRSDIVKYLVNHGVKGFPLHKYSLTR